MVILRKIQDSPKDIPSILNQTKSTHINTLQSILVDSYSDKIVRDMDSRQNANRKIPKVHNADDYMAQITMKRIMPKKKSTGHNTVGNGMNTIMHNTTNMVGIKKKNR